MDSGPNHNNMDQYSRDSLCCAKEQFNEVVDNKAVLSETHVNHDEVHGIDIHPIDHYVNIFYDGEENEVDTKFYNITQNNIDTNFVIPTPKISHQSNLAPVVLMNIKAINGVKLTKPFVDLCDLLVLAHQSREGEELNSLAPESCVVAASDFESHAPEVFGTDEHGLARADSLPCDQWIVSGFG